MKKTIGIIGCGNMGSAIISGIIKSGLVSPDNILVSDTNKDHLARLKNNLNINIATDNKILGKESHILILAVKPNIYPKVIEEIKYSVDSETIIASIAAGIKIETIESLFGRPQKIVRVMPNTPALVREGMTALCVNDKITISEQTDITNIFNSLGRVEYVKENLLEAVTGVSGSSPAYTYMFIEALADAAVLNGLPRDKAYIFASQAVLGAAKMVLETKKHPGELKDMVTSPGGTTIEGIFELEKNGFRNSVISAVNASVEKSKVLGRNNSN